MKRKILSLLLAACLSVAAAIPASAETFYGGDNWVVRFTADRKMESTFKSEELDDAISGMQPGDNIIFQLTLKNEYPADMDWYMTNKVLYSLEDRSANSGTNGGAYTYELRYTDSDGQEHVLFSSSTVGGDTVDQAGEGLHEATDSLEDFFYLDTLGKDQSGSILLEVALDGETQGNDYQDTLADLQMNFAVELSGKPIVVEGPKTGDPMALVPWLIVCAVSGLSLLCIAIISLKKRGEDS